MAWFVDYDTSPEKLKELQSMDLTDKMWTSIARIMEFSDYMDGKIYISCSGGKDSTVLLHLTRRIYPDVPVYFANTGLEYPEIQSFAKKLGATFVYPKMRVDEVISRYGYPLISKEVSEAIYYARTIRNGGGQNREAQAKRTARKQGEGGWTYTANGRDRALLEGGGNQDVGHSPGWRRACLTGTVQPASGFREAGVEAVSPFNKKKYLPLCRDTPFLISHYCCNVMKKQPMSKVYRETGLHPIIGTMADESRIRKQAWLRNGCNAFDGKHGKSTPLAFWTEQDILHYIVKYGVKICSVYGDIVPVEDKDRSADQLSFLDGEEQDLSACKLCTTKCDRTGCMFCAFGFHNEKKGETRFQRIARTHPKQYEYAIGGGQWVDNPKYDPVAPKMDGEWENWNPKQIWVPSKKGLGMGEVFRRVNEIYGSNFYRWE